MEENEFRQLYHSVNQQRCIYEKSIIARRAACSAGHKFCIATREGVACNNSTAQQQCQQLLSTLRDKAIFALQITRIDGPLPHAKEIKVQTGGLLGLRQILQQTEADESIVTDITALIQQALEHYATMEQLPYDEITRSIVKFEGRQKRRHRKS